MSLEEILVAQLKVQPMYREQILQAQQGDDKVSKVRNRVNTKIETPFQIANDGVLILGRHMYMPKNKIIN